MVLETDLLQGRPAEEGVVADEGRGVAIGDGVTDGGIDKVSEECNARFEIAGCDIHDA